MTLVNIIDQILTIWYYPFTMSQDKLIRIVSEGDENGVGKGHIYYTRKNKRKHAERKFEFKKFNYLKKNKILHFTKKNSIITRIFFCNYYKN